MVINNKFRKWLGSNPHPTLLWTHLINSFSIFQVPGVQFNMMTQKKICIALHMPLTSPFIIWYSIGFSYLWLVVVEWWPVVAKRLQKCHHLKEKENKEISKLFCKNNVSFSSSKITKLQNLKRTMVFCNQNCSDLLWEKIVLVIDNFYLRSLEQFIQTVKGQDNFW